MAGHSNYSNQIKTVKGVLIKSSIPIITKYKKTPSLKLNLVEAALCLWNAFLVIKRWIKLDGLTWRKIRGKKIVII